MKIEEYTFRNRRDFRAIFVCEHCGHKNERYGYDDDNFHVNVIPKMECPECGKVAPSEHTPQTPRYPSWAEV